jgi:hypothetical protein
MCYAHVEVFRDCTIPELVEAIARVTISREAACFLTEGAQGCLEHEPASGPATMHPSKTGEERKKYEAKSFSRTLLTVRVFQRLSCRAPDVALGCACDGPSLVEPLVSSLLLALRERKPQAEKARPAVQVSQM